MPLVVANWKMYKTYKESLAFAQAHSVELASLSRADRVIALAPSFVCLEQFSKEFKETPIKLCAQDCAPFKTGAYTGEVDATSLAQIGCAYGIVGHSERRRFFHETDEAIAQKAELLLANKIIPIICVGETTQEFEEGRTVKVIEKQLAPLVPILQKMAQKYCIAYEPVWSIGTGKVPDSKHLDTVFSWLTNKTDTNLCTLLYGGSVDANNAKSLLDLPKVGGLLIGGASCDFQSLKKIVSLI